MGYFYINFWIAPPQNSDFWTECAPIVNEDGSELITHDLFYTHNGVLVVTGYFPEKRSPCISGPLAQCIPFKVYASHDGGKSWEDRSKFSDQAKEDFIKGDNIPVFWLSLPGRIFKKLIFDPVAYSDYGKVSHFNKYTGLIYHYFDGNIFISNNQGLSWSKVSENEINSAQHDFEPRFVFSDIFVQKSRYSKTPIVLSTSVNKISSSSNFKKVDKDWTRFTIHRNYLDSPVLYGLDLPSSKPYNYDLKGRLSRPLDIKSPAQIWERFEMKNGDYYATAEEGVFGNYKYNLWKSTDVGFSYTKVNLCEYEGEKVADDVRILNIYGDYLILCARWSNDESDSSKKRTINMGILRYYILDTRNNVLAKLVFPEFSNFAGTYKFAVDYRTGRIFVRTGTQIFKSDINYFEEVLSKKKYIICKTEAEKNTF